MTIDHYKGITPYYPSLLQSRAQLAIEGDPMLKKEIRRLLHPKFNSHLPTPNPEITLQEDKALELRKGSVLHRFIDPTGWEYVGKILRRKSSDTFRTQANRIAMLAETPVRNALFSSRIIVGLAPITYDPNAKNSKDVAIGDFVDPTKQELNPNLDYIWLMHRFPQGGTLEHILQRNLVPWTLQTVVESLIVIHNNSEKISNNEAVKYASAEALANKYYLNFGIYKHSILEMIERDYLPKDTIKQLDRLEKLLERIVRHPIFHQITNEEIECGNVVKGHGDTQLSNGLLTDFFTDKPIEIPGELGIWYDALDFEPAFYIQSKVGEAAMTITDMLARVPQKSYLLFLNYYLKRTGTINDPKKRAFLLISMLDKSQVRGYNAILWDSDYELGRIFIEITDACIGQLEEIFPEPNVFNERRAMRAGILALN